MRNESSSWLRCVCIAIGLTVPAAAQFEASAVIQYAAEEIVLGFTPYAMNNRGWIVGTGERQLMRYRPGIGTEVVVGADGQLLDINDAGTAVGYIAKRVGTSYRYEAIIRPAGEPWKRIGTLGGAHSKAYAINEAGQVVGWSQDAGGRDRPFIYTAATGMKMLFNHSGQATGINETGQIIGSFHGPSGFSGFLWDPVAGLIDIEGQPDVNHNFAAQGIADNGTVAGWHSYGLATFSLANGLRRLGDIAGVSMLKPSAVNDRGWIVGCDPCLPNWHPTAFLYVYGQSIRDLNSLLTTPTPRALSYGIDINDRDEILAGTNLPTQLYILKRVR